MRETQCSGLVPGPAIPARRACEHSFPARTRPAPPWSRPGPLPVLRAFLGTGLDQCPHSEFYRSVKAQGKAAPINPTLPPASDAFPRVKNLNPEAGEILDVAGRHGEAVLQGSWPDQAVNRRQRRAALLHPGRQYRPAIGDGLRDGQQPSLKGAPQILFEPFFQGGPPLARLAEFDALPDFSEGQHACEKETILGVRQPALDAGIGLTAPGELRQDIGVQQEARHKSTARE